MAKVFCLYHDKEHDHYEWKHRKYQMPNGEIKEGWVCGDFVKVRGKVEWVDDQTKEDRVKYFNSTLQPYRNGQLSREYLDAHGTRGINPTKSEIRKAKNVWSDLAGHKTRHKSL